MKFAVLDDEPRYVSAIAAPLRARGYEVLAIAFTTAKTNGANVAEITFFNDDFASTAAMIKDFAPDFVFLDHKLVSGDAFSGQDMAVATGLLAQRLIGTSADGKQPYCGYRMPIKKELLDFVGESLYEKFYEFVDSL